MAGTEKGVKRKRKGPRHGKRHVASLNHGNRSMTGPACGAMIDSPCTLEAVDAEEVDAELDGALCVSNSGCARCHGVSVCRTYERVFLTKEGRLLTALMQYDTPGLLELPDDWPRAVAGRLDDVDALVDDGLGVSTVVGRVEGRQEGDVDSEGVLGQFPALLDLLAQVCWRWEDESRDDAKPAGVGDGTGQLGVSDVLEQEPGVSISSCVHPSR